MRNNEFQTSNCSHTHDGRNAERRGHRFDDRAQHRHDRARKRVAEEPHGSPRAPRGEGQRRRMMQLKMMQRAYERGFVAGYSQANRAA